MNEVQAIPRVSLVGVMAAKYQIDPAKFLSTVKATIFDSRATEEEMMAFLVVANKYELDPFRKEVFAFRKSGDGGGIQPLVGVDGWSSIANRQPNYDGVEFEDKFDGEKLISITCKIHRKDRSRPTEVTEYLVECKRNTMPWTQWPARMLRHKAFIQCVRLAFGISGIMDPDEVERMTEAQMRVIPNAPAPKQPRSIADLKDDVAGQAPVETEHHPAPNPGQPEPAPAVAEPPSIPPRRRVKKADAVTVEALEEAPPVVDESGNPTSPEALPATSPTSAPKPKNAQEILKELMGMRIKLGEGAFGYVLKLPTVQGDIDAADYGLDLHGLQVLRAECVKAGGAA